MDDLDVHPLTPGEWAGFDALLDASAAEGFRFLARLRDEHASGRNRFDAEGEVLLGAFRGGELVGVGGLNRDPYSGDPRTGRIRHLYVLPTHRRHGTGRRLTGELLAHARHWFDRVVLRTDTAAAARFYEALGFAPEPRIPGATHSVALTANSPHAEPAEG